MPRLKGVSLVPFIILYTSHVLPHLVNCPEVIAGDEVTCGRIKSETSAFIGSKFLNENAKSPQEAIRIRRDVDGRSCLAAEPRRF